MKTWIDLRDALVADGWRQSEGLDGSIVLRDDDIAMFPRQITIDDSRAQISTVSRHSSLTNVSPKRAAQWVTHTERAETLADWRRA
jgi:hypothetical protein